EGDFKGRIRDSSGKHHETAVLYTRRAIPARRVVLVGLGKAAAFNLETARRAAASALKKARELGGHSVACDTPGVSTLGAFEAARAWVEGALLGLYRVNDKKTGGEAKPEVDELRLCAADGQDAGELQGGARLAEATAVGVYLARDLVNMPAGEATPSLLAQVAEDIADAYGMQLTVGDRAWAAERRMGGFLGVAQGAEEEPKFIVLEYNAGRTDLQPVVLVGKGITFDTGGISIKPAEHMEEMKSDMAGAAAVLGTMQVLGQLDLPLRVIAITPCTENMPDGRAYHPGDILTFSNGKTAEVISTDAEGRLILADALVYAQQYNPQAVIDLATLTGACVIALGEAVAAGLFSTDDRLRDRLLESAQGTHDRLWPMPLYDEYKDKIRSLVADMKNTGGRYGGVGASAIFLKEFTDYAWAHLDIAGMALYTKADETAYVPAGGTGFGVRLLVDLLRRWN
ncbi:MAG: leucyl aminopeptidase, partial [Chloroflexota bacterium]